MNGKLLKTGLAVLLAALGLASCSSDEGKEAAENDYMTPNQAEVAVLYYSLGGGDLDQGAELDFVKAAQAMGTDAKNVRFFVQHKFSGKAGYENELANQQASAPNYRYTMSGDFGCVYRFEMLWGLVNENAYNDPNFYSSDEKLLKLDAYKIGDRSYQMYQPANLADFIRWSIRTAPEAKSLVLCIGDHGGAYSPFTDFDKKNGTKGILYDDNLDNKPCMTNQEIVAAFKMLTAEERAKIKVLCFDCCLMSNLETLAEYRDIVPYIIGSSHTVPVADMGLLVNCMAKSRGEIGAMAEMSKSYITRILKQQAEEFVNSGKKTPSQRNLDYTVTDMSKMGALLSSVKAVREFLTGDENKATLTAKKDAYDKAASQCYQYSNGAPYYDVVDYLNKLRENVFPDNATFKGLVDDVKKAANAAMYAHCAYSYSLDPDKGTDLKGHTLTYSIILGSSAARYTFTGEAAGVNTDQGAIVLCTKAGEGTVTSPFYREIMLEDGNAYTHSWMLGDVDDGYSFDEKHDNSASYKRWGETYGQTAFDKATGWSQWMRVNPGRPYGNPPEGDEDDKTDWLLNLVY